MARRQPARGASLVAALAVVAFACAPRSAAAAVPPPAEAKERVTKPPEKRAEAAPKASAAKRTAQSSDATPEDKASARPTAKKKSKKGKKAKAVKETKAPETVAAAVAWSRLAGGGPWSDAPEAKLVRTVCALGLGWILALPLRKRRRSTAPADAAHVKPALAPVRVPVATTADEQSSPTKEVTWSTPVESTGPKPATPPPSEIIELPADAPTQQEAEEPVPVPLEYRLTNEEQAKVMQLHENVRLEQYPTAVQEWCTDPCLCRYLRARKWNVKTATKMLTNSLKWRTKFRPHEITWDSVAKEGETGKMFRCGVDREGRPIVVMRPARENTKDHEGQIRFLVYNIESAIRAHEADRVCRGAGEPLAAEQMVWLLDLQGYSISNAPPMKTSRETLSVLQDQYPERLGKAILYNPPRLFYYFWRMISPFIDPNTAQKVAFVLPKSPEDARAKMSPLVDPAYLERSIGGDRDDEFDAVSYGTKMRADEAR